MDPAVGKKVSMKWADGGTESVFPRNLIPTFPPGEFEADGRKFSGLEYLKTGVAFVGEDPGTTTKAAAAKVAGTVRTRRSARNSAAIASPTKVMCTCVLQRAYL